jgi:hypothetical protein
MLNTTSDTVGMVYTAGRMKELNLDVYYSDNAVHTDE